jgi:hypothetical protein
MPAPTRPAGTSGPGQYARRTDGGPAQQLRDLPNAKYGENQDYQAQQRAGALSQTPGPDVSTPAAAPQPPPNGLGNAVVPFSAPTQRPFEPVTAGAAAGPGAGPEALGISPAQVAQQDVSKLSPYLPILEFVANLPTSSPGSRMFVNYLKGNVSGGPAQSPGPAPGGPAVQNPGGPAGTGAG